MEKYNAFISSIEIVDVFIEDLSFKRHSFPYPAKYPQLSVNISSGECNFIQKKENLEIRQDVEFSIEAEGKEEKKKKTKIFELHAGFTIVYKSPEKMTDEIFSTFNKNNVPVNIHPYLREVIHSSMSRAGIPPVVIPVLKIKR